MLNYLWCSMKPEQKKTVIYRQVGEKYDYCWYQWWIRSSNQSNIIACQQLQQLQIHFDSTRWSYRSVKIAWICIVRIMNQLQRLRVNNIDYNPYIEFLVFVFVDVSKCKFNHRGKFCNVSTVFRRYLHLDFKLQLY